LPDVRFQAGRRGKTIKSTFWVGAGSLAADRWRPKRTGFMLRIKAQKVNAAAKEIDL
jgi:hypothetical protein